MNVRPLYISALVCLTLLLGIAATAFCLPDKIVPVTIFGVTLNGPTGIALDEKAGKYYIADQPSHKVLAVDIVSGVATIFAGDVGGIAGYNGDDIPASSAQLNEPTGVAVDSAGNVYIADRLNHRVRKVDSTTGIITTVAGNGAAGFYDGDGGAATSASLKQPTGVTIDAGGNMYIADNGNYRVRKVIGGSISTIAGDGTAPTLTPYSVALRAPAGDLYITDSGNNVIRKLSSGTLSIVAGNKTIGYSGDGGLATKSQLNQPSGITIDGLGDIYFTDSINNSVRKISVATSVISTRAGNSADPKLEPAIAAALSVPFGLTTDAAGNLYVTEYNNKKVQKITASVSAITTASPAGGAFTADSQITLTANKTVQSIFYTDDSSAPLTSPTKITYLGPFTLTATKTIKFASVDLAGNNEVINTATFTINKPPPVTTATPTAGQYNSAKSVVLTSVPVATIYYTTDGTAPTVGPSASPIYAAAIPINSTTTLKFFAVDTDGNKEATQTKVYTIDATAPTTTATPVGATYSGTQSVTLTADDASATIYYSTTGIAPTTATTTKGVGSVTLTISATTTLKYFAFDVATNSETVKTQAYTIDKVAPTTTSSVKEGSYPVAQSVTLTADDAAAVIHYTIDGTTPTLASPIYAAAIAINATTTLKFFAVDAVNNTEIVKTQIYTIDVVTPSTAVAPVGKAYTAAPTVTLTANDPAATIYYTINGATPTIATTTKGVGSVTLTISATTTLKYFSADAAGNRETVQSQVYTIDSTAPTTTSSLIDGTFTSIQTVKLTTNDATATIYYTTDGTDPTTASPKYTATLSITKTTTLKYFAQDTVGNAEIVKTNTYTIISVTTTARPEGGTFASDQTVTLENNVTGATIYYTIDGTTPTKTSKTTLKYTTTSASMATTMALTGTTILQYFAVDTSGVTEPVKAQVYTIDKVFPVTTAACNTTTSTVDLKADDASDPAPSIKYSLNGGAWTDYTVPFVIPAQNNIVNFYAIDLAGNTEQMENVQCLAGAEPVLNLETLPDNSITTNSTLYVKGTVAPATTAVTVNGSSVQVNSGDGSFSTKIVLVSGPNVVSIVAGATTATRNVTYNAQAALPALSLSYPADNITVTGSSILITGTVRAPSTHVVVSVGAIDQPVEMTGNSFTATANLLIGVNVISITALDIVGASTTQTRNITAVASGPALYINTPANDTNNTTATNPITLIGLVSSNSPPVTLTYLQSDGTTGSIIPSVDGTFSQAITLPAGSSSILVTATDTNGSTTVQRNLTLDQLPGTVTVETGSANSVIGYVASVPLTLTSGYQASSLSVDIGYDLNKITTPKAELSPLALAAGKSISTNIPSPGIFRILIPGTSSTPIPDGVVAYITFSTRSTTLGNTTLTTVATASDADSNVLNLENKNGALNVMSKPGDLNGDGAVIISEVQSAINMFLGLKAPADGAVDLNGNRQAQIAELQKVINSFMGL